MTTVPGTFFTREQLEAALKADKVSGDGYSGSDKLNHYGFEYKNEKKQYEKALAWYLLAAKENNSNAHNNLGFLYYFGYGVPKNYLCALKWYLKSAEGIDIVNTSNNIGRFFENGYGVPLDKYKALEWYSHGWSTTQRDRLKRQGIQRTAADKKKKFKHLRKETEAILDAEKKKLEEKQDKTQEDMEALVDLNITYKLADGGKDAWKDVPILLSTSKQRYTESVNSPVTTNEDEILELKKQNLLLKREISILISQAKELPPIKQEESNFQLEIKERDRQIALLRNDFQLLQQKNDTFLHQIKTNGSKIVSLQRETQELKLKNNNLEQQVREKDNKIALVQTENQSLRYNTEEYQQQLKSKDTKINLLENEKRGYRRTSMQQTETLNSLQQEKQMMEHDKTNTANEIERLKATNMTLEHLLKSKEDTIISLNRENQGHQQGANEMVETLKSLLEAKNSENELLKQNMEHVLEKGKGKIKKLQKEIKRLEQNQRTMSSRKARHSTVPESATSNNTAVSESTASNTGTNEDDPNNDISYDTESGTEHNSSNDSSSEDEDEDNANDFNYDSDVKR